MIPTPWLAFCLFVFGLATPLSLFYEQATTYTSNQLSTMQYLTGYNGLQLQAGSILTLPKLAFGFLFQGLPTLLSWDYGFLDGPFIFIRVFLTLVISGTIIYALAVGFAYITGSAVTRLLS